MFAFWDGEEFGLLGSRYFTDTYKDMQKVKGYLNFDMVGSGTDSRYLMYFFTASHPKIGEWLKADMAKHNFCFDPDYRAWDNPVGGSDQQSFHLKGCLSCGITPADSPTTTSRRMRHRPSIIRN